MVTNPFNATAADLKQALRVKWPGVKWSVRQQQGTLRVAVAWTGGPVEAEVRPVAAAFTRWEPYGTARFERVLLQRTPAPPVRVQRSRKPGAVMPPGAVFVGRPTMWGNPFVVKGWRGHVWEVTWEGEHIDCTMSRREAHKLAVELYVEQRLPLMREEILARLAGRDLACWCPPVDRFGNLLPCHGDVMLAVANGWALPTW